MFRKTVIIDESDYLQLCDDLEKNHVDLMQSLSLLSKISDSEMAGKLESNLKRCAVKNYKWLKSFG
jgi:hypothetical protein